MKQDECDKKSEDHTKYVKKKKFVDLLRNMCRKKYNSFLISHLCYYYVSFIYLDLDFQTYLWHIKIKIINITFL